MRVVSVENRSATPDFPEDGWQHPGIEPCLPRNGSDRHPRGSQSPCKLGPCAGHYDLLHPAAPESLGQQPYLPLAPPPLATRGHVDDRRAHSRTGKGVRRPGSAVTHGGLGPTLPHYLSQ